MKPENYKQCVLTKGSSRLVSWLPNHVVGVNKMVKLRRHLYDRGFTPDAFMSPVSPVYSDWDDGWMIEKVFGPVISRKELDALGRQYKDTRKASDV